MISVQFSHYKTLLVEFLKAMKDIGFEIDSFVYSSLPIKSDTSSGIKGASYPYVHGPHTHKTHITLVFQVLNSFHILKHSVTNPNLSILRKIQIFSSHPKKV